MSALNNFIACNLKNLTNTDSYGSHFQKSSAIRSHFFFLWKTMCKFALDGCGKNDALYNKYY